jgi:protein-disulfide isomerase
MSRFTLGLLVLSLACACQKPATTQAKSDDASGSAPVATWKGGSITASELDARMFDQRKQTLDQMLIRKLIDAKAKDEKISSEDLIKREVTDKVPAPTEADMKKVYDEQSKRQPLPPYEQIKPQIAQYMKQQNPQTQQAYQSFIDKLKKDYDAQVTIKPPRVEVAADGPSRGAKTAPITIVEFSDFQCPFCSRAETTVNEVMKAYDGKVKLVYRDYPLPFHAQAQKAAEAAHCAEDQGKYWEMHEKLFANQQALQPTALKGYAKDLGLDTAKFDKCLDSGAKAEIVETNRKAGEKVGVTGTPAFFINGYSLSGAQPLSEFKTIIDSELASNK